MLNRPKYKTARRLGANVFDKTMSAKFALRESRRKIEKRPKARSEYGLQLLEKQKAKTLYGVSERVFSKYVKAILDKKGANSPEQLMAVLESRLDNVVYRMGFAPTRQASRQMVAHGHFTVNGTRVTIPSYSVKIGDKIAIRDGSKAKTLFTGLDEKLKTYNWPSWLALDIAKKECKVQGLPKLAPTEVIFDGAAVLNFYSR
ncbi:MAG: 30S ribosomal protein S4 [bacterium]